MPLWKIYHPVSAHSAQDKKEFAEKVTAMYSMRNLIRIIVLLALLGNRATIAQTVGSATPFAGPASTTAPPSLMKTTRLIGGAPIGHRQPHARDVPSENAGDLEHISQEDAAVDRKLIICRGC